MRRHFPETDEAYKGIASMVLLSKVKDLILKEGYNVNNIDATIAAQQPKIAPYIKDMNENIAQTLKIEASQVNVKATTTEGLGFVGNKEGIAAYAIVSLIKID